LLLFFKKEGLPAACLTCAGYLGSYEKKQKTFANWASRFRIGSAQTRKSFLVLFFKKELLPPLAFNPIFIKGEHCCAMLSRDADWLYAEACRLDAAGETERARQAYLDVLACDLAHAGALARLGTLLFGAGFTSAARTVFSHAVAAHPADASARVNLAHLFR
jgi:tetratricopeptide (TPR) repeat protein